LQAELQKDGPELPAPAFLLDGSTVQLQPEADLRRLYPPAPNQHGHSHWPVVEVVVLHDLRSGVALCPVWGPKYGPKAISEQALAEEAMKQLPPKAIVLGDRNFGIFATAYKAHQRGHSIVFRLTKDRARPLASRLRAGTDQKVVWRASAWDRQMHPEIPPDAVVAGRLLVFHLRGRKDPLLCLFTTLDLPTAQIVQLYGCRWNIETDLRSLKQTIHLQRITAKSADMMEKELLLAFSAYNLVRAVMFLAARQAGISPRELSFSRVQDFVMAFLPSLATAESIAVRDHEFRRLLGYAARCRLPKRQKRRSYPRAVWNPGYSFPWRKCEHTVRKTK
jgi:hypothetical protein